MLDFAFMEQKILNRRMSIRAESPSAAVGGGTSGAIECASVEIMLFGVRVKVDPMRKSVSMNNLFEYEPVSGDKSYTEKNQTNDLTCKASDAENVCADGYASADDAVPPRANVKRKRGVPWTEDEHKLFLIGLQKVGKGDWRGISKIYVKTRTPTQVASHAQKYFIRRSNLNRRRRRTSLFDITTDSVTAMPTEEGRSHQPSPVQPLPPSTTRSLHAPMTVFPVPFAMQYENPMRISTLGHCNPKNNSSTMLVDPISIASSPTMIDLNLNEQAPIDSALISSEQNRSLTRDGSAFQVIPGFKTGDSLISVA